MHTQSTHLWQDKLYMTVHDIYARYLMMDEALTAAAAVAVGEENIYWSTDEVHSLIEAWSKFADEVNQSRNEGYMQRIADHIGTNKNAKQVRTKVS